MKDHYTENYKTLKKEIKEGVNIQKGIPSCYIGRNNTLKMCLLPKAIYGKSNPYQDFNVIFSRSRKNNPPKKSGTKNTLNSQNSLQNIISLILVLTMW